MNIVHLLALTTALGASTAPSPDETCILIDRAQRVVSVRLTAISESMVSMERGGLVDHRNNSDLLVALLEEAGDSAGVETSAMGRIELTDGQRWVGTFVPIKGENDRVEWDTANLGRLSVGIEHVRRMQLRGGDEDVIVGAAPVETASSAIGDRLILTNGDVLRGFLESAGEEFVFETNDGDRVELSFVQVAQLELANLSAARQGMMVWLSDGSVLRVESLSWSPESMQMTIAGRVTPRLSGTMLRGVAFAGELFAALSDLEPTVGRVSDWMSWVEKPRIVDSAAACGLSDVQLRGPVEVSYSIPQGATELRTMAIVPRWAGPWADLVLVVSVDGREVWREAMDATGRSRRDIAVDVAGGATLTLRVEEGGRGPVSDVVMLERPMILLGER